VSFEVVILGSGAAIPTVKRNPTAQYVVCNNRHILIDCGEGTQLQMRKLGIKFQRISHILISHLHGDHFFGLPGLLSTMHLMGRDKGVSIYGPEKLESLIRNLLEAGGAKLDFELTFFPLNGKNSGLVFEDKCIEIHTFPLKHRIPTNGFLIKEKIKDRQLLPDAISREGVKLEYFAKLKNGENIMDENGKIFLSESFTLPPKPSFSYAYCSDTCYWESIVPHIAQATVLYHEATFTQKDKSRAKATFHSTAEQAARIAKLAEVKKLLLGHMSARYVSVDEHLAEAKQVFANTYIVEDGATYKIG